MATERSQLNGQPYPGYVLSFNAGTTENPVHDPEHPERPAHRRAPIPPEASRQDALGRLRRELWHAQDAGELGRCQEIRREIEALSARNTPTAASRETTSSTAPKERRATTLRRK